jgi:electron transport complex protein RnfA
MTAYLLLLLSTALVNNVVLVKFLGLCPFMGVSGTWTVRSAWDWPPPSSSPSPAPRPGCWNTGCCSPSALAYLRILTFILVIAATVQFVELVVKKSAPALYQALGIYLPLITTNCAVLGLALLTAQEKMSFVTAWCMALARRSVLRW